MKQLDKMLLQAKKINRKMNLKPVHIIEDNYCYACKGECKYIDNEKIQIEDNVVIIIDDIPADASQMDFSNIPTETLIKIANMKEGEPDGEEEIKA